MAILSPGRIDDATKVLHGLGLVAAKAASQSKIVKRCKQGDLEKAVQRGVENLQSNASEFVNDTIKSAGDVKSSFQKIQAVGSNLSQDIAETASSSLNSLARSAHESATSIGDNTNKKLQLGLRSARNRSLYAVSSRGRLDNSSPVSHNSSLTRGASRLSDKLEASPVDRHDKADVERPLVMSQQDEKSTESSTEISSMWSGGSADGTVLSEKNAERLADSLCRMRGAALKVGQMLSIQDEALLPPQLSAAMQRVRAGADVMPERQLAKVLRRELGPEWRRRVGTFDTTPFAAASIGQVAKKELKMECDYVYEAACQNKFRLLIENDPNFVGKLYVPYVVESLSSTHILTSEFVQGVHIDQVVNMSQEIRDHVGTLLLTLTLRELFDWHFMQTDPNWANFLYDEKSGRLNLIDFGASRGFPVEFVDGYLRMVKACADGDREGVIRHSKTLGFLTGTENDVMLDAYCQAGAVAGAPFAHEGIYNFADRSHLTKEVRDLSVIMLQHRQTPPPDDSYSMLRKMTGAFLACIKLGSRVPCRKLLMDTYESHEWGKAPRDPAPMPTEKH